MSRCRSASNPLSFHNPTGQYYVTRGGKRIYLGSKHDDALIRYHKQALGESVAAPSRTEPLSVKELANRFLSAQQANWSRSGVTRDSYHWWLKRFLLDRPCLKAHEFTVEMFAVWKLSLRERGYAARTINHFLKSVRAIFAFAEDSELIAQAPRLKRIKNEAEPTSVRNAGKPLYGADDIARVLAKADYQMKVMIMLALNCGLGVSAAIEILIGLPDGFQDVVLIWDLPLSVGELRALSFSQKQQECNHVKILSRRSNGLDRDGRLSTSRLYRLRFGPCGHFGWSKLAFSSRLGWRW